MKLSELKTPLLLLSVERREGKIGAFKAFCGGCLIGDNRWRCQMDPRGPGGANGPRWVGGWYFHRQHQHGEQDSEEVAASNAPLGAPLQHLNGSMLIYVRISCDERARRGVCGLIGYARLHVSRLRLPDAGGEEDTFCDIYSC